MTAYPRWQASESGQSLNGHTHTRLKVTDDCLPHHSHGLPTLCLTHTYTCSEGHCQMNVRRWQEMRRCSLAKKNSITNLFWDHLAMDKAGGVQFDSLMSTVKYFLWPPTEDQEQIAVWVEWNTHWPLSHKDTNHDKSKMISDLIQKRQVISKEIY